MEEQPGLECLLHLQQQDPDTYVAEDAAPLEELIARVHTSVGGFLAAARGTGLVGPDIQRAVQRSRLCGQVTHVLFGQAVLGKHAGVQIGATVNAAGIISDG